MIDLPTLFPNDSITTLLPILRGSLPKDATSKRQAATAAWNIIGYATNLALPPSNVTAYPQSERESLANYLQAAQEGTSGTHPYHSLGSINWKRVIDILWPLYLELMA